MKMEEPEAEDDSASELPELSQVIGSCLPSPSPPKKRCRIDSTNPLYRPFKSPFKTPLKTSSAAEANTTKPIATLNPNGASAFRKASPSSTPTSLKLDRRVRPLPSLSSTPPTLPGSKLDKLQKHHTSLLNTLSALRARLETTNQALEIEASNSDAELQGLIQKWRSTSRDAAEEVFGSMKEKVQDMGGMVAWRRKEAEEKRKWDDEERGGKGASEDDDTDGAEELAQRERREEKAEEERQEAQEDDDADGFTMEMMLKSMNIPLETIGYDKELQGWRE
ncbi:MAG: hypothetical protein Q9182_001513 [Xanthomendoza sp. 2 TL-2023]